MNFTIQCMADKNKQTMNIDDYDDDGDDLVFIHSNPEFEEYVDRNSYYKHNMARIMQFMLSQALSIIRSQIIKIQNKFKWEIVHCHTDGFIVNKTFKTTDIEPNYVIKNKQKFIELFDGSVNKKQIGQLKLEYKNKNIKIVNATTVLKNE